MLRGHEYRDATHDPIGEGLLVICPRVDLREAECRSHPNEDVAAPERAKPGAARAAHRKRDDRSARTLRNVGNTRAPAYELARFAAMSLDKQAERLTRSDHGERHLKRAAIPLAASDRERADGAQQKADDRCLEELLLSHVADRVTERELDPRRVLPVDVIRDEDVSAGPRDVLGTFEMPGREECRERANDRKEKPPEQQLLLGKDRRSGDDGQERVTCRTRSRASRTESPSVSTRIASSAARSGATVRLLSSSSRRRISLSRS